MKNNIMKTINNMYKSTPTLEESELLKLDSLLTQVGGDAKSILLSAEEHTMADFIDTCIRNGITFELRNNDSEVEYLSGTAPVGHDNPSTIQSPSGKEKSCEGAYEEPQKRLTRVTLDNWKDLLFTGEDVISFDNKGNKRVSEVTNLEGSAYGGSHFMELDEHWTFFEDDNICDEGRKYYVEG